MKQIKDRSHSRPYGSAEQLSSNNRAHNYAYFTGKCKNTFPDYLLHFKRFRTRVTQNSWQKQLGLKRFSSISSLFEWNHAICMQNHLYQVVLTLFWSFLWDNFSQKTKSSNRNWNAVKFENTTLSERKVTLIWNRDQKKAFFWSSLGSGMT